MPSPARLGSYVLTDTVAVQGVTVTYRAQHAELGRQALVKTLKPTVSPTSPFAQELEREARILATLSHDGIVTMLDFVRTPEAVGLVLEDPGGHRLADVLAKTPRLEPFVAAAIGADIARALGHAHERGVVHRDLRPERVVLLSTGAVKIADFGGAHAARLPSIPDAFEGDGTFRPPDYMAPELLVGEPARPASDVFSLGTLLFEMLTGVRPFAGPDAKDVARRIRTAQPASFGDLDVPPELERIVTRALAKEPDDRYADGNELALALERALLERADESPRVLVTRALAAAGMGPDLPATMRAARAARAAPPSIAKTVRALLAVSALVVAGAVAIEVAARSDDDAPATAQDAPASAQGHGYLRLLATPWADVLVDGELIDTTPIARAIAVAPGHHYVTFRHPNAPDEKRTVRVAAGQTIVVDVTMRIERPSLFDAGAPPADTTP